jgi:hypothetical protein
MPDEEILINQAVSTHNKAWEKLKDIGVERLSQIAGKHHERFLREGDAEARIITTALYAIICDLCFAKRFPDVSL